jgi:glycosyltransferase involved in cell wall biosynthesis
VITGEVPDTDAVRDEYRAADIFCLPSLQEGFGIAFLEAMASGLPIVACRSAAVPEVVPDGEAGLLVPPDDPKALARALIRLLSDPLLRRRMGEAGMRKAREHAWEEIARRFVAAAGF